MSDAPLADVRGALRFLTAGAVAVLLGVGGSLPCAGQEPSGRLERAQVRIDELFRFRVGLMLEALGRQHELDEQQITTARERLQAEIATFRTKHPAALQPPGPFSRGATTIEYEPFSAMLATEGWRMAVGEGLPPELGQGLMAVVRDRDERVRDALIELIGAKVERGLCLAPEEREALGEVLERAADEQIEAGLVEDETMNYYGRSASDPFFELMKVARLEQALSGARRTIFEEMGRKKHRTALHDYRLEVEYLLHGLKEEQARRLLVGCAEALVGRDGKQAKESGAALEPVKDLAKDRFWNKAIRGTLALAQGDSIPPLPSRNEEEVQQVRARFLLAVLDRRAFFSEEQRESLLPLLEKFVKSESTRRGTFTGLQLPSAFMVSGDGLLILGENRVNRQSTRVRALIKTLYETCTADQREVLES